jgi:hypothetical protein
MNMLFVFQSQVIRPVSESDDAYPNLSLNGRWRVIECRDGLQWILQARNRTETVARDAWRGRSYCRSREALIRCCDRYAGVVEPAAVSALMALPAWFGVCTAKTCTAGAGVEVHHAD